MPAKKPDHSRHYLPVPPLPASIWREPVVVRTLERMSCELGAAGHATLAELTGDWARLFRYHIDHARTRLMAIHQRYEQVRAELVLETRARIDGMIEIGFHGGASRLVHWDFEAYLAALDSGLEILALAVASTYPGARAGSLEALCKRTGAGGAALMREEMSRWIAGMRAQRGYFMRHVPGASMRPIVVRHFQDGWEIRCDLPANPDVRRGRDVKITRGAELLRHAVATWRRVSSLDRKVASFLAAEHEAGRYPPRGRG